MPKIQAYINIGSNMGDRLGNLHRAVALISEWAGKSVKVSDIVESEPWGYQSVNHFLNIGIIMDTELPPENLLDRLQMVERTISPMAHRDDSGAYIDRLIDVDIITYGCHVIDTPRLKVPHPFMAQRRFVLQPLVQLNPQWQHPLIGLTASEMLACLA